MTNVKIGATTWDSKAKSRNRSNNDDLPKFNFMKLKNGNNIVRIITAPYRYLFVRVHGPKASSHFGDRVNVADPEVCPAQKAGLKPKERYYAGVYDYSDSENPIKILDMSVLIHEAVSAIIDDLEEQGKDVEPSAFQVNIRYNKGSDPANTYNVIRRDIEPMSEKEQAAVDAVMADLTRVLEVKSGFFKPETVQKRMEKAGWTPEVQAEVDAAARKERDNKSGKANLETSSDDDYSFDKPAEAAAN